MFPIMDINNKVIGFGGRVMGDAKPKYLNSPETKLFDKSRNLYGLNAARISRKSNMIICAVSCTWHSISGTLLAGLFAMHDKRKEKAAGNVEAAAH